MDSATINTTGEATLASAIVSDLTSGRVVLAGTGGAIEDSTNLTFDGSTLGVTGAITASTTVTATGNVAGGNLTTAGQVAATGNVAGGNITTGGAMEATGLISSGSTITATGNVAGGNITTGGRVDATGAVTGASLTAGNVTVNTDSIDSAGETLTINTDSSDVDVHIENSAGNAYVKADAGTSTVVVGENGSQTTGVTFKVESIDSFQGLKETGAATEVVAVTVGKQDSQEQLRTALALGADRAILVESDSIVEPLVIAKALAKICEDENPNLIILGKQAIDGDNNQTGQMLSALMGYSQATNASEVNLSDDSAEVTREIDGGLQTIKISLPAIVTTDLRLNEPRYASLPNIMKAKKKELNVVSLSEMGFDTSARTELLSVELPAQRAAGIIVESVDDLIDKLKNEAKVIS